MSRTLRFLAAGVIAALVATPLVFPPDGKTHADLLVFAGRMHPVLLHFPVALLALAPVLEIAGAFPRMRRLREYAGPTLLVGALAALPAMLSGYVLAYSSGLDDDATLAHLKAGVALVAVAWLAVASRPAWAAGRRRFVYPVFLALLSATLLLASHLGGSLSHGETYLTDPLPPAVKRFLGVREAPKAIAVSPDSGYALTIAPIFEKNCLSCHKQGKSKGDLRMDDFASLMKGGRHGPAVVAGKPEIGELIKRVTLPSNDRAVMPPEGTPLTAEEIGTLRDWIAAGASPTAPPLAGARVVRRAVAAAFDPVGDYASLADDIRKLETRFGIRFVPVSAKASDGLILRATPAGKRFDDAALPALSRIAPFVTEAEFARTGLTDAAFAALAAYANLRVLHLDRTALTGAGIDRLSSLKKLTYLNLSQTRLTAAALASLKTSARVYSFDTPATPVAPVKHPEAPKPAK